MEDREEEPPLLGPAPVLPKQIAPDWSTPYSRKQAASDDDSPSRTPPKYTEQSPLLKQESPRKPNLNTSPTPATGSKGALVKEEDEEKPPLVGTVRPLEDFRLATASGGDVISEAVTQLAEVITELAIKPKFPNKRKAELLECMKALRETCIKVGLFFLHKAILTRNG